MRKSKTFKKAVSYVLAGAMILTSAGFTGTGAEAASSVKLNKTKATLAKKGKKVTLKVTAASSKIKIKSTKWTAPSKKIATVTQKGVVKAVWAGDVKKVTNIKCTVKFTKGSKKKVYKKVLKCKVTVKAQGTSVTPTTDTPATDTPATDTPATDTPATDTPATDTPATDTPATDTPATDTPATDTPTTDTPATDTPTTDTPATDTPATDTPESTKPEDILPASGDPVSLNDGTVSKVSSNAPKNETVSGSTSIKATTVGTNNVSLYVAASVTSAHGDASDKLEVAIAKIGDVAVGELGWHDVTAVVTGGALDLGGTYTFTNLNPGTKYTFAARVKERVASGSIKEAASSNLWYSKEIETAQTGSAMLYTSNIDKITDTSVSFKNIVLPKVTTGGSFYVVAVKKNGADLSPVIPSGAVGSAGTATVERLEKGTEYGFVLYQGNSPAATTMAQVTVKTVGTLTVTNSNAKYNTVVIKGGDKPFKKGDKLTASDVTGLTVKDGTTDVTGYTLEVDEDISSTDASSEVKINVIKEGYNTVTGGAILVMVKYATPTAAEAELVSDEDTHGLTDGAKVGSVKFKKAIENGFYKALTSGALEVKADYLCTGAAFTVGDKVTVWRAASSGAIVTKDNVAEGLVMNSDDLVVTVGKDNLFQAIPEAPSIALVTGSALTASGINKSGYIHITDANGNELTADELKKLQVKKIDGTNPSSQTSWFTPSAAAFGTTSNGDAWKVGDHLRVRYAATDDELASAETDITIAYNNIYP